MASSGSAQNNFFTKYYLKLRWEQVSQSIPNNNTTIKAYLELYSDSYYNISSSQAKSVSLTINGSTYSGTANVSTGGGVTKQLFTATHTVGHNSDGSKIVSISGTCGFNLKLYPPSGGGGTQINTVSVSTNATLNTIPRASSFSISATHPNFGNTFNFNINRASSGFTHTIQYSWEGGGWTNLATGVGASYSYTIPMSWISSIPNKDYANMQYRVLTYSGSTHIGTSSGIWQTISVPSNVIPSITSFSLSETGSGKGVYIQGKSKVNFNGAASGTYGSTIRGWTYQLEGVNYNSQSGTTGVINGYGNINVKCIVSDSRGRYAEQTRTIAVWWYGQPSASIKGFRANASGIQDDSNGTYIKVTMNSSITTLDGINTTSAWLQAWNGTAWVNLKSYTKVLSNETFLIADASLDNQYKYRLSVSDAWTTITSSELVIPTGYVTVDFKKGGKGIAFGKVAELDNTFECNMALKVGNKPIQGDSGTVIPANADLNDYITSGTYWCPNNNDARTVKNNPTVYNAFSMQVIRWNYTDPMQIVYDYAGHYMFVRIWDGWSKKWFRWATYPSAYFQGEGDFANGCHWIRDVILKFANPTTENQISSDGTTTYFYLNSSGGNSGLYDSKQGGAVSFNKNSGVLTLRAGYQTSDSRFKGNINPLDMNRYYDFYMSLKPTTFTMNDELQKKTHWGLIAQDVKEELIKYGLKDSSIMISNPTDETDDGRKMALNYQELITMNLKMIQEHEKIVNNQQEVIGDLVIKINKMDTILNDTNKTISQMQETINQLSTRQMNNEGHAIKGSNKYSLKNIKEWFKCKIL